MWYKGRMSAKLQWIVLCLLVWATPVFGDDRPNIILICADDLGWAELGCYGQKKIKTPHLDGLAKQGQRWTRFYSGAPVCSPSRNVILTGKHTGQTDVQDLKRVVPGESWSDLKGDWPITAASRTLPAALNKAGYATGAFGKWGMGEYGTSGAPDRHGIERFYGYTDHKMCHSYYPEFIWDDGNKVVINPPGVTGHAPVQKGEVRAEDYERDVHTSDLMADKMIEFVRQQATAGKPFFVYYAPLEPHVAMQPLREWVERYPKSWDKEPYRGRADYLPHPRPRAGYAAMISQMDHNVGRLLKALSELGLERNTIVVFTSDNGTTHDVGGVDHRFFDSVAGLRGLKGQMYEGGLRVPCLVRWPGRVRPGVVDQPACAADLMPTLCRLAGADAGEPTGVDLTPVLSGTLKAIDSRRPMVWAGGGYGGQAAVRIGGMKVMRRNLLPGKTPTDWEVYDLGRDEREQRNVAADHKDLIREAIGILDREYRPSPGYPELRYKAPSALLGEEGESP